MIAAASPKPDHGSVAPDNAGRDRFVAFAFVAADLLVEASPEGVIRFAAGAFAARLGASPEAFIGRHVSELVAPADRTRFDVTLASANARGRSSPTLMRLAGPSQAAVSVAGLLVPGPPARLCITFGAAPAAGGASAAAGDAGPSCLAEGATSIVNAASMRLLTNPDNAGQLGLVELKGWAAARRTLPAAARDQLRADIGAAMADCGSGALASEIADGRFTVLAQEELDLAAVVERLERVLSASPAGAATSVTGANLRLATGGLDPSQAARALRFALACFAERGAEGALAAGGGEGLSGIMARAETRTLAVRQAILDRRFRLLYQPIAGLVDRRTHHYEALIRPVPTPGNPVASPQEYLTFVELVGLADELDRAVMGEAIGALLASPAVSVAVNVSGLSMQNASFCEHALAAAAAGKVGRRLLVELTETAEISDIAAAASHMERLRAAGIQVCLDDFGAGAASFRYLREFTFDFVKIDGSYVRKAAESARERGFVASIVDLARAAHAETVAEMIETHEQATLMQELGVQYGQGWLLGRPGRLP